LQSQKILASKQGGLLLQQRELLASEKPVLGLHNLLVRDCATGYRLGCQYWIGHNLVVVIGNELLDHCE